MLLAGEILKQIGAVKWDSGPSMLHAVTASLTFTSFVGIQAG